MILLAHFKSKYTTQFCYASFVSRERQPVMNVYCSGGLLKRANMVVSMTLESNGYGSLAKLAERVLDYGTFPFIFHCR